MHSWVHGPHVLCGWSCPRVCGWASHTDVGAHMGRLLRADGSSALKPPAEIMPPPDAARGVVPARAWIEPTPAATMR